MDKGVLGKKYTNALVLLLRLRQAACHRDLVLYSEGENTLTKLDVEPDRALELAGTMAPDVVARIKEDDGE
jgi:hypothetical protein